MTQISSPLNRVHQEIALACKASRREVSDITLIAVSKTRNAAEITPLLEAGHRVFGENRVAEAEEKWPALKAAYPGVKLHLIGQLQSNKAEAAVRLFDAIHSLDRLSLLEALAKAMEKEGRKVPCFIQVNIGEEEQKGGCAPSDLNELLMAARAADIPIAGLMCIPPAEIEPAPFFAFLYQLAEGSGLNGVSMGMSGDFRTAIMLGASHIRVGTALFGERG